MVVCIAEDRLSEQIGVKLLIASLARHCPGLPIELVHPPADEAMQRWLAHFPQVKLHLTPFAGVKGWNVKPFALRAMLAAGCDEVWWIDSDILVCSDFRQVFGCLHPQDVVATEEAIVGKYRDDGFRALAWGFDVGRPLPFSLNSGVVRVTQSHGDLIDAWCEAVEAPLYLRAQSIPFNERPFHMAGDQDILTALLAAKRFSHVPLKILRRGRHIIQDVGAAGYLLHERALSLGTPPMFLHTPRERPWHRSKIPPSPTDVRSYLRYVRAETSPYVMTAAKYQDAIDEPMWWVHCQSTGGMLLRWLGFGHSALTGLPLTLLYHVESLIPSRRVHDRFRPATAYEMLSAKWRIPPSA